MALLDGERWRCSWPGQSIFGPTHRRDRLDMTELEVDATTLIRRQEVWLYCPDGYPGFSKYS